MQQYTSLTKTRDELLKQVTDLQKKIERVRRNIDNINVVKVYGSDELVGIFMQQLSENENAVPSGYILGHIDRVIYRDDEAYLNFVVAQNTGTKGVITILCIDTDDVSIPASHKILVNYDDITDTFSTHSSKSLEHIIEEVKNSAT